MNEWTPENVFWLIVSLGFAWVFFKTFFSYSFPLYEFEFTGFLNKSTIIVS